MNKTVCMSTTPENLKGQGSGSNTRDKKERCVSVKLFIFNKVYLFILFHLYTVDRNLKKKKVAVHVCDLKSWL